MIKKTYIVIFVLILVVLVTNVLAIDSTNSIDLADAEQSTSSDLTSDVDTEPEYRQEEISLSAQPKEMQSEPYGVEVAENEVEEPTTVFEEQPEPTYSEDDLYCLAVAVCREAGGESDEMQLLVANVVINRVNSSLYPDTIRGVLTQYRQYGTMWRDGISFPSWANDKITAHCYDIAQRILDGERYCPENVLFQAEFRQGSGVFKQVGNMYFCYYEK